MTKKELTKWEIAMKLGFSSEGKAYLIYGDDTYAIKDKLKELGARFDPTLKWFCSSPIELPEGYKFCVIDFDDLYEYNPRVNWYTFKENAKTIVRQRLAELQEPSTSIYYEGEEKQRIYHITAKVKSIRGFNGYYGYTYVYTFTSENYVFVWMTSKYLEIEDGDVVDLCGTIKKFDEYMGVKQTHLTRCIVKKID